MKQYTMPLTRDGELDLAALRTAPRAAAPVLDTASIMDAIRAEAAVRPVVGFRPNPAVQTLSSIAAALVIAWSAMTLLRAPATADSHIQTAWLQTVSPAVLEATLTSDQDTTDLALYNLAALSTARAHAPTTR